MASSDAAPLISPTSECWQVVSVRDGRIQIYRCDSEKGARRFAELLAEPLREPPGRRYATETVRQVEQRISVLRPPPRWANGRL